jgi:hypothetical protein
MNGWRRKKIEKENPTIKLCYIFTNYRTKKRIFFSNFLFIFSFVALFEKKSNRDILISFKSTYGTIDLKNILS